MTTRPDARAADVERRTIDTARRLADAATDARVFNTSWWNDRMLGWAMNHPSFRTQLFRFVDVFPSTSNDADALRHLEDYLGDADTPRLVDLGISLADHIPLGDRLTAHVARRSIERTAGQFIAGTTAADAVDHLRASWDRGIGFTLDLLGEHTVNDLDADRYAARMEETLRTVIEAVAAWPAQPVLERDDKGSLPRANVSVKPSAFAPSYAPLTRDDGLAQAAQRLRPLLRLAASRGAFVWFDMESYDTKELTLELFRSLLDEPGLEQLDAGIVVQAYLTDSFGDLEVVIEWARRRSTPVGVRLVKGAYWDAETIRARAAGWPSPVFQDKRQTDANYERCTRLLLDHAAFLRPAFGTHNLRSIAHAIEYAAVSGVAADSLELQLLYGMAVPVQEALAAGGQRTRVYAPVGELVPGMAYLVRRLLENTANESFIRVRFGEHRDIDDLVAAPDAAELPNPAPAARRPPTDASEPPPYQPEPVAQWHRGSTRGAFAAAVRARGTHATEIVPAIIDGRDVDTASQISSIDPADPERVVARSASCTADMVGDAIAVAQQAWPAWRALSAQSRAGVLFGAAEWLRARRAELAALEVFEVGKPWADADADVCEAIDFCEYYGREAMRLDAGGAVQSPPGESNRLHYQPRGIGAVIAPWNFPLAIPTGMVTAALVAGNAVVFKPAEQSPAIARQLVRALLAAGLPPGVIAFLPGRGEDVGAALVEHPDIAFVTFTGSREVGLGIVERAARHQPGQRHVKRVVAEMGGKNPIIVDSDADLDVAVPAVLTSAFGYAGQKCSAASRLVVLDAIADSVLERLVDATRSLRVGHPRDMAVQIGPLVDHDALSRVQHYLGLAARDGSVLTPPRALPARGWFVEPTIVDGLDASSPVLRDEIFGPVLAVQRATDIEHALALANETDYALTGGVISRSPSNIRLVVDELRAGNVYVNRATTGAVVGRQPFGGFGLSGVGSKAGGPDYLLQFTEPRVVTENTVRQGFAPD
ncbi:MAG TPA: proline dehydrogenase family protein [Acidimicrobiales bacterium]|nr:proline dehydrogenase family protein [Acidimicrobiales bacterium]